MEYAIIGGYLEIDRKVFVKEMLSKGSRLRKLINAGDIVPKPLINNNESQNTYVIDFTHSQEFPIEETYSELLGSLKADYQERIKGKVTIRVNTPYNSFFTEYDLNRNFRKE